MRVISLNASVATAVRGAAVLLFCSVAAGQQQVNLSVGSSTITLPDGLSVPMWGYTCGAVVTGSTATCAKANPSAAGWSPVVITVPTGQALTLNLTNNLSFIPAGTTTANTVPTSIVIVGQVGGGLGTVGTVVGGSTACTGGTTCTTSPAHGQSEYTWSTVTPGTFAPPPQGPRAQSFGTEVAAGNTAALTWSSLLPGTYLIESGTHPSIQGPMGLYGILVVTAAPTFTTATTTTTTTETAAGTAYPTVSYDAEVPLIFSEIDPVQNNAIQAAVNTAGFSETKVWSGQPGGCGNPASGAGVYQTCYPPAVNYTPLYYLINGVAFNKTSASTSLFPVTPTMMAPASGNGSVLVRIVNAGLRMHVPSIVGSLTNVAVPTGSTTPPPTPGFALIAEDGNVLPGLPRVQSEVFMAAGKTYDVMINGPTGVGVSAVNVTNGGMNYVSPVISFSGGGGSGAMATATLANGVITAITVTNPGNGYTSAPMVAITDANTTAPGTGATATAAVALGVTFPIFDRELSLSGNAITRDAGMLAYIGVDGGGLPTASGLTPAIANTDTYLVVPGVTLTVADPAKGVIANDINVYGVKVSIPPSKGSLNLNANGTFTYTPNAGWTAPDTLVYQANGTGPTATVTFNAAPIEGTSGITLNNITYTSKVATYLKIAPPGILSVDADAKGYPLSVVASSVTASGGLTLNVDKNGGFLATVSSPGTYTFTYNAQNSQGTVSATAATVTLVFPQGSGLNVSVVDGTTRVPLPNQDYRWIIEEDRTFYIDPKCTTNPLPASCPQINGGIVPTFGTNFHTSDMPYVAQGCTGLFSCESGQTMVNPSTGAHVPAVCDVGNGACRSDTTGNGKTPVLPSEVVLDPTKRYYISVLPGDAANPFYGATATGHGMGGAPIPAACTPVPPATTCTGAFALVTVLSEQSPYPPGKLSVMVFEDDFPLSGEQQSGGGIDVLATNSPGLGGFQIHLWDDMGGSGDFTGQMTYDMFNQPLSNSLAGTIDPATLQDACPISKNPLKSGSGTTEPTATGITGMIVTCPKFEADGVTLSPFAGQAVIANLMPGRFSVIATPGADRIARGEEWLQTNTLDGQKAQDSFIRIGEPGYFQEYGPAGYHVSIGFANPAIINGRLAGVCAGTDPNLSASGSCTNGVTGHITAARLSRPPDERLYGSGTWDAFFFTQCFVSLGDPDGEDFAFTKCDEKGNFTLSGLPPGTWRITVFDKWNDLLMDGLSTPVALTGGTTTNVGEIAINQWQANIYTRTFIDDNNDGVWESGEGGIPLVNTTVRYRDGSMANNLLTDFDGVADFNETFPLFNWYVVETDTTRYKNTGTHVVYDAGGPADGTTACGQTHAGYPLCGTSGAYLNLANTNEPTPVQLPNNLRVPGAVYCDKADCGMLSIQTGPAVGGSSGPGGSTGRIDPPWSGGVEGWQGFTGQNNFLEFGKEPYAPGENGGIKGHVIYASTRPFDDPQMLVQTQWEPLVPHVTINLYQEGTAPDGTQSLTLVDTTQTSSWDDFAQGFRPDGIPNMNCPGQSTNDLFYFTLYNQPNYLNLYNSLHGGPAITALPNNSQFKCYDGMHNWNQVQPAQYDGLYKFPSVTGTDPVTGKPSGTNCTICQPNQVVAATDMYYGLPMLPTGKYVVEVVLPPGYEVVKEEDKNILIGDNFIAPVTQQFGGLSAIFILPDQASVAGTYNANNAQNPTQSLGANPNNGIVPGFVPEPTWPCVGEARIVPDYISLYPKSQQVAPFAGATRRLCDRKEVTLGDQMGAIAKFFIYTSTHKASKFTGVITDDFTSEFDPFSPQFGEKFSPPNMPVSVKDWAGAEISRVYSDEWGDYNGLTYSTWEVNPPNPTGYSPTMMIFCMNDPGTGITPDPLFNPGYSQFCYELPYMPGQTQYLDTPVVPTTAFSDGYNHPDCSYPALTPAISEVDGDGVGPYVSAAGNILTIKSLGDQTVVNYGYSGPAATTAPFNAKTIVRHYGFGSAIGSVTIGGVLAPIIGWSDTQITVNVPGSVPACTIQQQAQYGGSATRCGQLVITTASGQQSVDTVTVTIGGKAPTRIAAGGTIQSAIDAAAPGDLIILPPGVYNEILIMWKPIRLQGVGAASSIINANPHPAGKLDPWRRQINCLFGLALNGQPVNPGLPITFPTTSAGPVPGINTNPYDPTGTYACGSSGGTAWTAFTGGANNPQVDRLPLEAIVGWDTTVNGNLAEMLNEPSLLGAFEGAGITVLAKGVRYPPNVNIFGIGPDTTAGSFVAHEGQMPVPTVELTQGDCITSTTNPTNPFPSNFQCNPSSIDGLSVTNSSQGGGGIFVHAWGHNLQIANNRIYNNTGTLTGGITVGQGESPDALLSNNGGDPIGYNGGVLAGFDQQPWTCLPGAVVKTTATPFGYDQVVVPPGTVANQQLPYCYDLNVNVHHNMITSNSSIGDELYSGTPAGAGGVTFCTGSDYYKFSFNWVCGNMSTGDGGGFSHTGFIYNGDIEHNSILFNQSLNPTISTNGGGIIIMGAAPDGSPTGAAAGTECGSVTDVDCAPGLPDGTGPGLVINANLIMGNAAESGSGGGLRLQSVNGTEVGFFPSDATHWNAPKITNNIIVNNVAGWDGGGVSLQDSLEVNFINNTVISNDSTASAGPLFNTIGAPNASAPGPGISGQTANGTSSLPQPAGLVSVPNTPNLVASFAGKTITCPTNNPNCTTLSNPLMYNNLFWQNRSFYIGVGAMSPQYQQNIVTLYNSFTSTPAASQTATGACVPASYWDIGVRGDKGPADHSGTGIALAPTYSVVTDAGDYPGLNNLGSNPTVVSQYCNGSRTPPEYGAGTFQVPPGIADATVPNPAFTLLPNATVDEGNNWVNMSWGPLSMTNPVTGTTLGNYALALGSPAIDAISPTSPTFALAPSTDFFGNPRPDSALSNRIDIGAIEYQGSGLGTVTSINPNTGAQGTGVNVTITGTLLAGATALNGAGSGITVSNFVVVSATTVTATFTIAPTAALTARNITITTPAGTSSAGTFTVIAPPVPTLTSIAPASGLRGTSVNATLTGTNFTTGSTVNIAAPANGLSVSNVVVGSATTITATFTSTPAATLGADSVYVVTPGGASTALPFTVTGPVLTAIGPVSGMRGTAVNVTLTGSGLSGATTINVSGNGIAVSNMVVVSDTTLTATFTISNFASGTARNVTVSTPAGTSNAETFTVTVPPGALTSISPTTGARGTAVPVTLLGSNLTGATAVNVSGGGITASAPVVDVTGTILNTTFTISPTASLTARNATVTIPGSPLTNAETFSVVSPGTPTLGSIAPNSGLRGTPQAVTLTGTGFTTTGTTVVVGAPAGGLTIGGVTVVNPTTITATINTSTSATLGPRSISVVTPGGGTGAVTYTVNGPVLTSIAPITGARNTTVPVTLFGTGLAGTTAINVPGGGITVSGLVVDPTGTSVTANFAISAIAALTARNVTVTAPGGTSNAVTFTVFALPIPTLTSVAPASGVRGTSVAVTLTGTNLTGATAVAVSGTGVTVSNMAVQTESQVTATFSITTTAANAVRNVSITTPGGTSTSVVSFTVLGPMITSIAPVSGVRGTSVPVTFVGSSLTGATALTGLTGGVSLATGSLVVADSSHVTATLSTTNAATVGIRNIGVTTPIGNTNTLNFTISGATLTVSAPSPVLTTTPANTTTKTGTITVSNAAAATAPFTLTAPPTIAKVGGVGGTFSITGGTCTSGTVVAPGGSCTIVVQYAPGTSTATATANVTVAGTGAPTLTSANFTAN